MIKSFSQFLTEQKNLHLEHIEDAIVNDGIQGAKFAISVLKGVANTLSGYSDDSTRITVKWDGSPAIFAGVNPENGKFFVGTKSVFNKVTPKLNYTSSDIDRNHSGDLAEILKIALTELSKMNIKGVIQGDILFTRGMLKKVKFKGVPYISFKPNTISYMVPDASDVAKKMKSANLGVVFHTTYSGKTMSEMRASFGFNNQKLTKNPKVWLADATFRDESGVATFSYDETQEIYKLIDEVDQSVNTLNPIFFNWLASSDEMISFIKVFINSRVRLGKFDINITNLRKFLDAKFSDEIEKLKTDKAKAAKKEKLKFFLDNVKKYQSQFELMFFIQKQIAEIKLKLIRQLVKVKNLDTFIETPSGFKVTSPEGFVAIDRIGNAVKLVDRLEFSRQNFMRTR